MSIPLHVLIIEDSEDDALLMVREVENGGYDPVFERVETVAAMRTALDNHSWDVILSDYKMPHFSGSEALAVAKETGLDLPFIIVSGSIGEEQAVATMRAGAHDYIFKDNLNRLVPAIERELREAQMRRERKRAEEELALKAKILDNATDMIFLRDLDGNFLYANEVAYKSLGYSKDDMMRLNLRSLLPPAEHRRGLLNKEITEGSKTIFESARFRKDKSIMPVEVHASVIKSDTDDLVLSISRDITERKRADEALRESEERYRNLFEGTYDMIQSVTLDGHFIFVNKAWQETLGYTEAELSGLNIFKIIHPESLSHCQEMFSKVMAGESVRNVQATFVAKDGRLIEVEGNAIPRFMGDRVIATQGFFRDITERKQAEVRVRHLTTTLRAVRNVNQLITREKDRERLIQQSCEILVSDRSYGLAWIALLDEKGKFVSTASAGVPANNFSALTDQIKRGEFTHCMRSLMQQEQPYSAAGDVRHEHKGCPLVNIHKGGAGFSCRLEHEGKLYGTMSVDISSDLAMDKEEQGLFLELCGDISFALASIEREEERVRLGEELLRSRASLVRAQHLARLGSWDRDIKNGTLQWSDEVYRIFGLAPQELGTTHEAFLNSVHPDDRDLVQKSINEALYEKKPYDIEYRVIQPDNSERVVHAQGEVTFDETGKPVHIFGTIQDITERKRMEEKLIVTDRLASIGELASGIAHELNNPLTSVIGFSQLLMEQDVPDNIKEDLDMIHRESQRTAGIIKNLLTFARKHAPVKEQVNINSAIERVLELRAYEQRVRNIEVITRFAPDLPVIMADYFQLQQVFVNIIINAEHFMIETHNRGTLTITTEKAGDIVRASFADDGPGIDKEHLGHLFDPFFTTKEVGKGTGLGLSICHGIITEHGGKIYAKSKPGKGATFVVELPTNEHSQLWKGQ